MKANIERIEVENTCIFQLVQGSLLNLATGAGSYGVNQFDLYRAVLLLRNVWMFDSIPADINQGMQRYPHLLMRQIVEISIKLRAEGSDSGL